MNANDILSLHGHYKIEAFQILDGERLERLWLLKDFIFAENLGNLIESKIINSHAVFVQNFNNLVVNTGGAIALDLLAGAGGTVFNNANAFIGIGNGNAAPAVGQTDLQGASKTRKAMDATFPSRAGQVMSFRSTFGAGDANYSWEEIGLFNAAAAGTMFSRSLISAPFTKTAALVVITTYTLTSP